MTCLAGIALNEVSPLELRRLLKLATEARMDADAAALAAEVRRREHMARQSLGDAAIIPDPFPATVICADCNGKGEVRHWGDKIGCPSCGGTGEVVAP